MNNERIVIYREPNGTIHPISIVYGNFFIGADTIAVFTTDEQIKKAIKAIKALKSKWTKIAQNGQFHILLKNTDGSYAYPITVGKCGVVSHNEKGKISRGQIEAINGYPIVEWLKLLKSKKQLGIA